MWKFSEKWKSRKKEIGKIFFNENSDLEKLNEKQQ